MYQTTEIKLFKVIAFDEKQGSFTSTSSSKVLFTPLEQQDQKHLLQDRDPITTDQLKSRKHF